MRISTHAIQEMTKHIRLQTTQPTRGGAVSHRSGKPGVNCDDPVLPQQWGPDYHLLGKPAMRSRWMAGNAPRKSGRC